MQLIKETLLFLVFSSFIANNCVAMNSEIKHKIFIMLDVDNTITDRINPENKQLKRDLIDHGYLVRELHFTLKKHDHFFNYYKKRALAENTTLKMRGDALQVNETVVIRPTLEHLLQSIIAIGQNEDMPVHILICSRKDDTRTQELVKRLNYQINEQSFQTLVDIVPRAFFRVKITLDNKLQSAKSAALLRSKYHGKFGIISPNDYVILIDQLEDDKFITENSEYDLNLKIPAFTIHDSAEDFASDADYDAMTEAANKLAQFIE